jgi:hypothetical protein
MNAYDATLALCARLACGANVVAGTMALHIMARSFEISFIIEKSKRKNRNWIWRVVREGRHMSIRELGSDLQGINRFETRASNLTKRLTVNLPRSIANCFENSGN